MSGAAGRRAGESSSGGRRHWSWCALLRPPSSGTAAVAAGGAPRARRRLVGVPLLLLETAVDGDGREVAVDEQFVERGGARDRLDKDDELVELERVEEVDELAVLGRLLELHVVLLQAVERELGALVDVDLVRVVHELLADRAHLGRERGREHHDLLLVRRRLEDALDVAAHVELLEHLVALVEHKLLELGDVEVLLVDERQHAAGRADDDVRLVVLERRDVLLDADAAVEDGGAHLRQVLLEAVKLVADLERELARVAHHQRLHAAVLVAGLDVELLQHRQHKHGRLAHARLGLAQHVVAQNRLGNALVLHLGRVLEAAVDDRAQQLGPQQQLAEARRVHAHVRVFPALLRSRSARLARARRRLNLRREPATKEKKAKKK